MRAESGISVIELSIASMITLILVAAVLSMLDSGTRHERVGQARYEAQLTLRTSMNQISRELRQALSVDPSSNQTRLDMQTLISGTQRRVVYEVVGTAPNAVLQRSLDGGAPALLAERIVAPQAFCYHFSEPTCMATSPTADLSSVRISLQIAPVVFSQGTVTLATDVQLRNVSGI